MTDVERHNREAWNRQVDAGNPWTIPVSDQRVAAARRGDWSIVLTPTLPVPREWFGELPGSRVLCLASGGGQQAPLLAAAGARVTLLDNSPRQIDRDREVAERNGLELRLELGSMIDLSRFPDGSFDLVFHPVANVFIPDVLPLWRECHRVLRPGGRLLAGFSNPVLFLFDEGEAERGELIVRHTLPYSDLTSLTPELLQRRMQSGEALEFGHTLEAQLGGQMRAGFALAALYEDAWPGHALSRFMKPFIATLAIKPER